MSDVDTKRSPGKDLMNPLGIAAVTIYLLAAILMIIWGLVALWPPIRPHDENTQTASPTPTPGPSSQTSPTPPSQATKSGPAGQTTASPPTGQSVTPGIAQTPTSGASATTTMTPTPSPTPVPYADECSAKNRIRDEFCLNEKLEKRKGVSPAKVLGWCGCLYDEDRLLLLVLLAGALGSLIHGLRSFVFYVGNRKAVWSWSAYYVSLPFIGAGIAFIFYLVIRGGFFSTGSTVENTSPVGFAAIAALIGMFTEQAVQKLKSVSETVLAPAEKGKDHIDGPAITSITPRQGPPRGGNEVSIKGENFSTPTKVTFGGVEATVTASNSNAITLLVPARPDGKEGKVDVVVIGADDQKFTERDGYEYKNDPTPTGETLPPPGAASGVEGSVSGEGGDEDSIDGCDVKLAPDTPDQELPITTGGVV